MKHLKNSEVYNAFEKKNWFGEKGFGEMRPISVSKWVKSFTYSNAVSDYYLIGFPFYQGVILKNSTFRFD